MFRRTVPALSGLLLFSACGDDATIRPGEDAGFDAGEAPAASAMVGPEGGYVEGEGLTLAIAGNAVDTTTRISIFVEDEIPEGFTEVMGPVLRLEPSGLTFDEPALINIDAPPDFFGRVYLSNPDGTFDPIGFVEWGKARAFVPHFSTLVMSGMGCGDTAVDNNQSCECYEGTPPSFEDGVGALCPTNPGAMDMVHCGFDVTDRCRDYRYNEDGTPAFVGREGNSCSGQGRRPELRGRCYCVGTSGAATGISLCRNMFDFTGGMMMCPCGIFNFEGSDGTSTTGYYVVDSGPPDYIRMNASGNCQQNECLELQPWAGPYEGISGLMTNCVPQAGPTMPDYPPWDPMGPPPAGPPMGPPPEAPAASPSADCPAM